MIIESILDTDLYKLTMQQALLEKYPDATAQYRFIDRNHQSDFPEHFAGLLRLAIMDMSTLQLSWEEAEWLTETCPYLKQWYVEYLSGYRFDPNEVHVQVDDSGHLHINIGGPWYRTILWEVPLLAIVSELYFRVVDDKWGITTTAYARRTKEKAKRLEEGNCLFADFGTRRRRSLDVHDEVVLQLRGSDAFLGTSNVALARKYRTKPIGTMAHEWIMGVGALRGLKHANRQAMHDWADVYGGNLGIALADTYGTDAFLDDFDMYVAKLFDGVRHDSGDPYLFAESIIQHYEDLGIDPKTKTIIFSDGLTPESACEINEAFSAEVKCAFGIGTNFTNDFPGSPALNIVIKLAAVDGIPVVKLSDYPSKVTGDKDAIRIAEHTFFGTPLDKE